VIGRVLAIAANEVDVHARPEGSHRWTPCQAMAQVASLRARARPRITEGTWRAEEANEADVAVLEAPEEMLGPNPSVQHRGGFNHEL
jgi:hypothetical protein